MYRSKSGPKDKVIRELREENESLKGALQAVLLSLEAMVAALARPAQVEVAQGHLGDALVVIQEELDV